ncbi:conserved hypothetical protein [uncultured Desulfobacterium sp.]|uniref:SCP2 domain-containing protein n=1 Tax=uncultured Desulfobacterium sp. TaxID=201089 RepID=A0A445MTP4_9BACT|nr:conserved hypothetical protein [uncultured Desulfobacterium sp.]
MFKDIVDVFKSFESEITEKFLEMLLNAMKLAFDLNKEYRRNIEGFKGRYLFKSRDNSITTSAVFENERLRVDNKDIRDTDVTVTFRDSKALRDYILSPKPDILGSILRQDVVINGNFNYLYKFAYLAKHLQLMATGKL